MEARAHIIIFSFVAGDEVRWSDKAHLELPRAARKRVICPSVLRVGEIVIITVINMQISASDFFVKLRKLILKTRHQ